MVNLQLQLILLLRKLVFKGENITTITHRPADDIPPQLDMYREKYKDICKCDEDVLTCALFESVAEKFLTNKYKPQVEEQEEVVEINLFIGDK